MKSGHLYIRGVQNSASIQRTLFVGIKCNFQHCFLCIFVFKINFADLTFPSPILELKSVKITVLFLQLTIQEIIVAGVSSFADSVDASY